MSSGWDRKIYLWDLSTFEMIDVFKNNNAIKAFEELAADSMILGIDYSKKDLKRIIFLKFNSFH